MNAKDLLSLLRLRHKEDVFFEEVKDGESRSGYLRADAWAMRRSWAKPVTWAYEIKVSRSDFLADDKWHGMLKLANEVYFVCPSGLIKVEEVPDGVGLMYAAKTCTRLLVKRKAHYRQVAVPESLYRYLLMNRVTPERPVPGLEHQTRQDRAAYWKKWLAEKEEFRGMGWMVSKAMAIRYRRDVEDVRRQRDDQEKRLEGLQAVAKLAKRLGINDYDLWYESAVKSRVEQITRIVPPYMIKQLRSLAIDSKRLADELDEAMKGAPE